MCAAGGWGKPPVDEAGRPVYGDVFGLEDEEVDEDEQVSCLPAVHAVPVVHPFQMRLAAQ